MQEISTWTWRRGDGSEYAPSAIPAFWRRVAARNWPAIDSAAPYEAMLAEYGSLAEYGDLIHDPETGSVRVRDADDRLAARNQDEADWKTLHDRLRGVARLWRFDPDDPASHPIHSLDTVALARDPDARAIRSMLDAAGVAGDLAFLLDGWRLQIMPMNLRAFLLMGVAADIDARQRLRRCYGPGCGEWFPVARTDQRFCSNGCRQAAHLASKGAA